MYHSQKPEDCYLACHGD